MQRKRKQILPVKYYIIFYNLFCILSNTLLILFEYFINGINYSVFYTITLLTIL